MAEAVVVKADSAGIGQDVERARAEVVRLAELEVSFFGQHREKASMLADLEASAGSQRVDEALAGKPSGGSERSERIAVARAELDELDRAIEDVRQRRQAAIPQVWQAEAARVRAQA